MDSTMTKVAAVRAARNVRQSQRAGLVDATSAALALEAHERHAITARLKERHEASEEITSAGGVDLGLMLPLYAGGFGIQAYSNHALNAASYFQREVGELLEVLAKGSNTGPECGRLVRCPVPPRFVVRCPSCCVGIACSSTRCNHAVDAPPGPQVRHHVYVVSLPWSDLCGAVHAVFLQLGTRVCSHWCVCHVVLRAWVVFVADAASIVAGPPYDEILAPDMDVFVLLHGDLPVDNVFG